MRPGSIEIATRAADHFTRLYYSAYDSATRVDDLPNFYRSTSAVNWNGNPREGVQGIRDLILNMPKTTHEVQSYDCHPIPGTQPPSLLVTVSGTVVHGGGPAANPAKIPKTIEGHPRVFNQSFMLVPDTGTTVAPKPGELAKYYITADSMRFVG
ncbi:NTF2-like protein [Auriscalpium vulgare]|uniref:NTF2-like protein n=1 Tax=Auriscalpium vulgare TaxID=40419 RepID=A0ACB8SA99_9AGAM|nr:NTF2-like protein [Auriscalpium vulgare]